MADQTLRDKRKLFVSSVNTGTLNGLLDELLEKRVLNQEEMERVRYENATVMDKARALIDSVLRKGSQACQIFICYICDEDAFLAEKMGLSSGTPFRSQLNSDSPAATLPSPDVLKLEEGEKKKFYDAKPEDKPWVFLNSVRQKRQEAGQALIQTFINTDKYSTSVKAFEDIMPGPPEPEESTDTLKLCPHEEFVKLYTEKAGEIYPIKERQDRIRLALIICNIEFDHLPPRNGAELDITGMKNLLEGLGYSVDVKQKLTAKDMESALRAFAARPEHESSDSTFLVLMSHGILSGICGTTFSPENPDVLPYDTIFQIFNNRNCFKLRDKPKVIIIQACRGENLGELWVSDSPAASTDSFSHQPLLLESDVVYKVHVEKDFVAFCSSTPHNVSWRHVTKGSLFIAQLITCFQKYSWCCHLVEVFQKVQQAFEKPNVKAQMPTIERMSMTKPFYLFPGN
ncbi:caspase-13 isoform X3 [Ailuropoda melanoleuca]|uniref:caspase-13 isoform X2 n=1 Tax=Ailuropoda melanoleuca TaxID=9646 RepID=UPI0014949BB6|nr:caspase-13 isoform X2 [Ailuropoda melanoleuca]XP_034521549.1 caspase-13 isoform X3 [Ailuropoda melanoleuca]